MDKDGEKDSKIKRKGRGRETAEDKERQTERGVGGRRRAFPRGITLGVSLHWSF